MYIYNVTIKVDPAVEQDWLAWMREIHIPEVMGTRLFDEYKMLELSYSPFQDESQGNTFIVQYFFDDMDNYHQYQERYAPALQQKHLSRYGDKVLAFRTVLKYI